MSQKFIFVNTDGDRRESVGAYEVADFINASVGVADAGKPIVLDAAGQLDISFVDVGGISHSDLSNLNMDDHLQYILADGSRDFTGIQNYSAHPTFTADTDLVDKKYVDDNIIIDHGGLTGLADDDHLQYSLVDGTRDYTGVVAYDTHKTFTNDTDIVDKKYVVDYVASVVTGSEWQDSCLSVLLTPPVSPTLGDRYLINGVGTGVWAGRDYNIAQWNGTAWAYTVPKTGMIVSVDTDTDGIYLYDGGGTWVKKSYEATTASLGVKKVGVDVRLDYTTSGGLALTLNSAYVSADDLIGGSTEGIKTVGTDPNKDFSLDWSTLFTDAKPVKASDLSSNLNGYGASIIGIEDVGGYTAETDVEGAIQEIYNVLSSGVGANSYTVGVGGVSKGDLLYVSGNNTVNLMPITSPYRYAVGIASTTVAAAGTVKVLANDMIITGILSGATAGRRYFWNGTAWTTTRPSGTNQAVWIGGIAKNATDLHIEVEFIVINS